MLFRSIAICTCYTARLDHMHIAILPVPPSLKGGKVLLCLPSTWCMFCHTISASNTLHNISSVHSAFLQRTKQQETNFLCFHHISCNNFGIIQLYSYTLTCMLLRPFQKIPSHKTIHYHGLIYFLNQKNKN